ncbi:MAG TPA: hypothetical protein VD997_10000 [Phycisphaerales bacterium]|nr:hypothetical protein [Phycisphaerales bacterium]
MRTAALALTTLALLGCQSPPPRQRPPAPSTLGASTRTITVPTRPAPTLAQAQQQQAFLAAAALESKIGIDVEPVSGAAPAWWPIGSTAQGIGRGQSPLIEAAYQSAVRQARGTSATAPAISKISYARLPAGDYIVWVQSATAAAAAAPTAPATPTSIAAAPTPEPLAPAPTNDQPATTPAANPTTPANPETPTTTPEPPRDGPPKVLPPSPPKDPLAPSWFSTTAREENGRVYMSASAEAATVREAPRMAIESARAALAAAMKQDVPDVHPEATFVTPIEGRYRAYVLVSTPGTIRK